MMDTVKRTAAVTEAAQFLIDLGIDRHEMGLEAKLLVLGFAAQNGLITEPAGYYLNRKPQTRRVWACLENGPILPIRINSCLAWPVDKIRALLEGGEK
jgi:hypothetical protein